MFNPIFHLRISDDFAAKINVQSMLLADIIVKESLNYDSIDVVPKVALCTLDIVCGKYFSSPRDTCSLTLTKKLVYRKKTG